MPSISKICPFLAQKAPNPSKFLPKPFPNRPKTFPKRFKIHPKGLLGPILDQCFYKIWFWKSKKASKCAQKWPQGCPERRKPFPNWAQHLPKSDFWALFCVFFFIVNLHWFFINFFVTLTCFFRADPYNSCAHTVFCWLFHYFAIFEKIIKNPTKIHSRSHPKPSKIHPKSPKIY